MATFNADEADNLEDIEKQFAVKAVKQAETYWRILEMRPGSNIKLTKIDDEIYEHFTKSFPEIDVVEKIDEDQMKSKEGKERWRDFIQPYEKSVTDFNFGTLLRLSPKDEYEERSTIFAVRMQFYAIEIARNKLGLNDWIYEKAQAQKSE